MTAPPPEPLADALLAYAHDAFTRSSVLLRGTDPNAEAAYHWMRLCREALEARRIADEPLTDGERAATAEHVKALLARIARASDACASAAGKRDELARFLATLAGEFESARTDTAARVAARIRRELDDVLATADSERNRA